MAFFIKDLILTGPGKRDISIEFQTGFNVIAGASNTGKSFIVQCIDFMLGAQKSPKKIPESIGYESATLVISTYEDKLYTLKRNLNGGPFLIKSGDLSSEDKYYTYHEKLSNNASNISTFLLSLCNLDNIILKKNAQNKKTRVSFRDVCGLCLIEESTIITENSPVYHSNESTTRTKEQSLFYYFLSGEDATTLTEIEDPKILKNKIAGKIEIFEELISQTQANLEEFNGVIIEQLETDLDNQYEKLNLEYRTSLSKIDKLRNTKADLFNKLTKLENKNFFNIELLDRFSLLEKHYQSDRDRLEFISEGNHLLNQLNDTLCPICGSDIKHSHEDHFKQFRDHNDSFEVSLLSELTKITLKQNELTETISKLKEDITKKAELIRKLKSKIEAIDLTLDNSLTPVTKSLRERLQIISESKVRIVRYQSLKSDMTHYSLQINKLIEAGKSKLESNEGAQLKQNSDITEFCMSVEKILNNWNFPNLSSVTFDGHSKIFDLKINNSPRATSGKGYRAITYSAFVLGLMEHAIGKERNHPKFLILDSPLTTFKDKDGSESPNDKVAPNVEFSFFDNLAKIGKNKQVIILDNKEPPLNLLSKINYIHFSGQKNIGRQGFFH